ncbi:MAG TPA: glycosyltransferase family 4 protein [Dehalococcoidia bacterium]|nr:glycosyltransferase family 4 protein [Dehalococcoidia bacterium]
MRILQLAPVWETVPPPAYGGTESVISVLTEELVRRGHDVLLCASGDSQTSARLFSVVPESLRRAGLTASALQFAIVHVAQSLAQAKDFDIVHNHSGPPSELAMAHCEMLSAPMLTTMHNLLTEETGNIWRHYSGWYNSISETQVATLPALPRARFAGVVHNAIDVESFPFEKQKSDYALFMGRISAEKAPHLAIEAALQANSRIVIAGKISTPDEEEYFNDWIAPLIDNERVRFFGEASAAEKRELFADARALLMPLQWEEPFGLVMVEAMACGTPVIAFDRGAAREIIVDGQTGFLVEGVDAMANALSQVGEIDPRCCRDHVEGRFTPGPMTDRYLEVYQQMLRQSEADDDLAPVATV